MKIKVKRVYDAAAQGDGTRVLVDRLWPRGLAKDKAHIDAWVKAISPSTELRKWYNHDHDKWPEFKARYFQELKANENLIAEFLADYKDKQVTLLFSSKEARFNNAAALKEYLESR
ncbi:MAG: hypothetical protein CMK83_20170 [Pseudomonadales bacterium]|jgi:uncharacterized protein YeaO (DUF488 family)|uniref:DUF488 domain-containing protein n=1 Tax=unclassified Ketobacter TaxID=2639109 RepID=UPI000C66E946|nr:MULTISPECIES: DUF488 family protein [unclassified Ketobacter]MAA58909.1 hypothetical protein [Pseudomonadales bacterium]MEC8812261.1 DUF488 family protein [Pseudomonadota bacterium]TNC86620.1 MAG: hypothetical protein CSH49_16125 [Alcanivorax sp.]HBO95365.1 hypothetical protein [Gammaproteobacteria bacterium]MAQ23110.1 hypothetical protein [Pseudomonadales bacterium]|tara:strand:- start:68 stop:415 length:348 start_codon:yes stop_codon:yes gene_type:complete